MAELSWNHHVFPGLLLFYIAHNKHISNLSAKKHEIAVREQLSCVFLYKAINILYMDSTFKNCKKKNPNSLI